VKGRVEAAPSSGSLNYFERAVERVPSKEQTRHARKLACLYDIAGRRANFGTGGYVGSSLDNAIIAKGDPETWVGTKEAAFAYRNYLTATTTQSTHDWRAATDIRSIVDDYAGRNSTLNHGSPKSSRIEVDEALMHYGRARRKVRSEPYSISIGNSHSAWDYVICHSRELVDANDLKWAPSAQAHSDHFKVISGARSGASPDHICEMSKDSIEICPVRLNQPVREQVQAQVNVDRVGWRAP
jgi:hypothetical protein